jgi:prolyl oligopeptidase
VTRYPPSRRDQTVDIYHGVRVEDPYRWLEDPHSPDTVAWTDEQNALTRSIVDGPLREELRRELQRMYDYPRLSAPVPRGSRSFFTHNSGLQNQAVLYVQDGLTAAPRLLLDPNTLSADGTVALTAWEASPDGRLLAYATSSGGSDWQEVRIRDVESSTDLPDVIRWAKFVTISWSARADGFYYTRFPENGSYHPAVWFHHLGRSQEDDALVFPASDDPEIVYEVDQSSDHRFLVVTAFKGASENSRLTIFRLKPDATREPEGVYEVGAGFEHAWHFVDSWEDVLFFRTNREAPRGCVLARERDCTLRQAVPPSENSLIDAAIVGGQLVTRSLENASSRMRMFDLGGEWRGDVALPALGSITEMTGEAKASELFVRFASFTWPPTILRVSLPPEGGSHDKGDHNPRGFPLQPEEWLPVSTGSETSGPARTHDDYVTSQTWYTSRDGARVSMFLVHRRDTPRDGDRPIWLTAYGGFNINIVPDFDPAHFVLLDRGGVLAVPNLRGGGEYGEAWHQAGMLERKQNVFDDFIAAAEHLIAEGYTRAGRIVFEGGSNGGLLVSAALTQRPDLPGAVICRVPVADMLRYHLFTVGRFWIPEYGCADDATQFPFLYAYSPLHRVRDDVRYPPVLIMTAETDDRVDPGMARKLAARLQAACTISGGGPACIRIEPRAGHGAGKPVAKLIEEDADIYAFALAALFPQPNAQNSN